MKRVKQLDSLRIFMMAIIVMSHLEFFGSTVIGDFYNNHLHNAIIAVDYFFMLSGFGLYLSFIKNDKFNLSIKNSFKFAINKIKKIYPIYVFSLIISIPSFLIIFLQFDSLIKAIAKYLAFFVVDLTLLQSATGMMQFSNSINGVCWFLSTLFICYMFSPLFMYLIKKVKNKWDIVLLICNVAIIIGLAFILGLIESKVSIGNIHFDNLVYSHPFIRIFYVSLGMIIAKIVLNFNKNNYKLDTTILEVLSIIIVISYFLTRNIININSHIKILFDLIVCGNLIFSFALDRGKISKLLSNDKLYKLGNDVMYIYLFHYPVRMLLGDLMLVENGLLNSILLTVLILLITFGLYIIAKNINNYYLNKRRAAQNG